jgi:hypothetical protein
MFCSQSVRVPHDVVNAARASAHICVLQLCEGEADEWPLNGATVAGKFISRVALLRPSTLLLVGIHARCL